MDRERDSKKRRKKTVSAVDASGEPLAEDIHSDNNDRDVVMESPRVMEDSIGATICRVYCSCGLCC